MKSPDLWQTIEAIHSDATPAIGPASDFDPFTKEEKSKLKRSIDELRLSIENQFNLQKKDLATINNLLEHLSDAVDKHNRFDWKGIAIKIFLIITGSWRQASTTRP